MSPGLTVTQAMEGTRSDVTWTHCDMRTRHSVTQGWRGQIEVMSPGLTVTQGRHMGAIATSHEDGGDM